MMEKKGSLVASQYTTTDRLCVSFMTNTSEILDTTMNVTSSYDIEVSSTISTSIQMSLAYIIIGCLGVSGNSVVFGVMSSSRALRRRVTNIYIINQSVLDLTVSVVLIFSANVKSTVPWPGLLGDIYCKIWQTKLFLWGFLVSSTYNLVALTIDRFLKVCKPVWHRMTFHPRQVKLSILTVWVIGPAFNAAYMIPSSFVINGQCSIYSRWPSDLTQKLFGLVTILIQFFVPLMILIYCYSRIALTIHGKIKVTVINVRPIVQEENKADTKKHDVKWHRGRRNTIKTLAIVATCFVVCWSWNQILFFINHLGYQADFTSNFYHFTVIAVFLNSVINPVVYAFKYEPFQQAARNIFCKCLPDNKVDIIMDGSIEHTCKTRY